MKSLQRGFTLIELLVVIAVVGVLSAIILVAINPVARINQANDAEVKSEIGQIATALATYATTHNGFYPAAQQDLVTSQDLNSLQVPPTGYGSYTFTARPAGCTAGTTCAGVAVYGTLRVPLTAGNVWCYETSNGVAAESTIANCTP